MTTATPTRSQRSAGRRTERIVETEAHRRLADVERWFIKRGLPHFIEDYRATDDVFNRALPLIVLLLMAQFGAELTSKTVTLQNRLVGGVAGLAAIFVLFLGANLMRQPHAWYKMPRKVGVVEMAVLVALGPAVGFAVRARPQAVALDFAANVGVLILIYAATAYAVLPVLLWAVRHAFREIGNLVNLASKALPMLALFGTFIFLNADMWHIASLIPRHKLWETVGFFSGVTLLFLMVRLPDEVRNLSGGYTKDSVAAAAVDTPLDRHLDQIERADELPRLSTSRRQRVNMLFVLGFTQVIQILLLSLVVFVFFVSLGTLVVTPSQMADWLKLSETDPLINKPGKLFVFDARIPFTHVILPDPLLQTAILITTFSAFFFAVSAVTDETYRKDFFESITKKLTRSLDVRCGYIFLYLAASRQQEEAGRGGFDPQAVIQDHLRTLAVPVMTSDPHETTIQTPRTYQAQQFQPVQFPLQQQQFQQPQQPQFPQRPPVAPVAPTTPTAPANPPAPPADNPFERWPQQE